MSRRPSADETPALLSDVRRRRQLWWLIGVLMALALALTGWYVLVQRAVAERESQHLTTLYARVLEDHVSRALTTTAGTLRVLSERGTLRRAIDEPVPAHRLLEQQLLSQSHLRSLSLIDDGGMVLVGTTESDVGRRVDLDALGRPADGPDRTWLGPPLPIRDLSDLERRDPPAAAGALALLARVPMDDDRPPLWLVALVNADYFVTQHMVLAEDSGVRALLTDLHGRVVATTGDPLPQEKTLASLAPFAHFLPQREHGSYIDIGSDGEMVVATFRLSRQWPVLVLAEQPLAAVRAAWREQSGAAVALSLLGLAGLLLLGLAADRSLRREQIAFAEREALHREVERTEERWQRALDAAGHCVWELDLVGQTFTGSPRLNMLLGGPATELRWTIDEWRAHIHPDDLQRALELFQQHLRGALPSYALEQRMLVASGDWLWVNVGGAVTRRSADGMRPLALSGTVSDISTRKAAESALRGIEARQQAILSSALDGIVAIDADGRLVEFNAAAERIFGRTRAELIGQPMHEFLIPPPHRAAHQAGMARHRQTGEGPVLNRRIEVEGLRASGEVFPMELAIVPVTVDAVTIFTATVRDISEPQRVQRELRASEERFRAAFDHAAVGMAQLDRERRVLRVNQAICRMLDRAPEDFEQLPLWALLHPDDVEAGTSDVVRLFAGEIASFTAERRYRHRDGHHVWARITGSATRGADGTPEYLVLIIEDISARRRAETELELARERELTVGARIQRSLLSQPAVLEQPGLWLSSFSQASQGVDGDFVEIVGLGDHGVDIVLGDVMGKGVAAALMGAATKMQFSRSIAELMLRRTGPDDPLPTPAQIVASVHRTMSRNLQSLEAFVTLSYLRLDTRTGRATWVGCGHEEPLLLRAGGATLTLANQHPPLGVLDAVDYTQDETAFDIGDVVFLCSDGAADALLPDGSRFGRERVAAVLRELYVAGQPPGSMLQALRATLARSAAHMGDDLTLAMAMRVDDPQGDGRREVGGIDDLAEVRSLVERYARRAGLDEVPAGLFTLACVEAFTNAVRHTRGGVGEAPIEVLARVKPDALVVEIVCLGDRYVPPRDRAPTDLGDYPEGGFGLEIIRGASDGVEYLHESGINTTRLTKRLR